jgi:hypothetical protein
MISLLDLQQGGSGLNLLDHVTVTAGAALAHGNTVRWCWDHSCQCFFFLPVFFYSGEISPEASEVPVSDLSKSGGTNLYSMHVVLLQCSGKTLIVSWSTMQPKLSFAYIYQIGALDSVNVGAGRCFRGIYMAAGLSRSSPLLMNHSL